MFCTLARLHKTWDHVGLATEFCAMVRSVYWVFSMEVASYQGSGAWNFEVVSKLLENFAPQCFDINRVLLIHFIVMIATCTVVTASCVSRILFQSQQQIGCAHYKL
jgi:hypothetical protein